MWPTIGTRRAIRVSLDIGSAAVPFLLDLSEIPATIAEAKRVLWAARVRATLKELAAHRPPPPRRSPGVVPCLDCGMVAGAHWGDCPSRLPTVVQPDSRRIDRIKSPHKGREVKRIAHQEYRAPRKATLPARNLRLPDGRLLVYQGPYQERGLNGGSWVSADGLRVIASMDPDRRYGTSLHVTLSYHERDPAWEDILQVRYTFYPLDIDVMMVLPMDGFYVNDHQHVFQLHPTPGAWSEGQPIQEPISAKAKILNLAQAQRKGKKA